jgi:hypothetical protein
MNHKQPETVVAYSARIPETSVFAWVMVPARGAVAPVAARFEEVSSGRAVLHVELDAGTYEVDVPVGTGHPTVRRIR